MKKFKKLIPALCMLLVSAVLVGTSTYAWFSMNDKVTVTGLEVKAKTDQVYLLISKDNTEADAIQAEKAITVPFNAQSTLRPAAYDAAKATDAVETAKKPAVTVHVRVQVDERQENSAFSIDQIQHKIPYAGNRVLRTVFISSLCENRIFPRGKDVCQLFLIAGGAHLTVMVTEDQSIGNLKAIQKCQQLFCLLPVVHRAAFRKKREYRISGKHHKIRLRPLDQFRHRCHGQFVLFSGKETEAKVQVCQLQYFIISVRRDAKGKSLFVPDLKVLGSIHINLFSIA